MKTFILCLLVASALAAPAFKPRHLRGHNKIVGGDPAAPGELPYQVSFQNSLTGFHFCGGSIYADNWVITAAHCVAGEDFDNPVGLQVVVGELNMNIDEGTEQTITVSKIIQHENYNSGTIENDIALLGLASAMMFDSNVAAIALPSLMQDFTGDATVSGWGTLSSGGITPAALQKVDVPIVSDTECRAAYGESDIKDSMICAGMEGKDSCQGDSGGPMVCDGMLCGIVSWGRGCALDGYPGVYTEVSYFVDWVQTNAGV